MQSRRLDIGRRRQHVQRPPASDPGNPQLVELLRAEMAGSGPLTFARFMQRALYEPSLGYYATSAQRPTRMGDFVTAPELHPIFGRTLARQLHEMWQRLGEPATFTLQEYGAGRGSLVVGILEGLVELRSGLLEVLAYEPRDLPRQLAQLEAQLAAAGLDRVLERPSPPGRLAGCVLANEFLDALPVHRVVVEAGRLRELYVDWRDGRFVEVSGEPSNARLSEWFSAAGVELADGQRAEVNLAMLDWLADVGSRLQRGFVLLIDYGAPAAELYAPARHRGTLRAIREQHLSDDILDGVGMQDLTAHVDLDALARGARAASLAVLSRTTQAEFLVGAGLEDALATARSRAGEDWQAQLLLRSAAGRLLDPRAMGGYAVIILGKGVEAEPPLRGPAYRLPSRA